MSNNTLERRAEPGAFGPDYGTSVVDQKALAERIYRDNPLALNEQFPCFAFEGTTEASNLGRAVELSQFKKSFGNDASTMRKEYGPYESASRFFVVLDSDKMQPAGTLRVIKNGPQGLKTLEDIQGPPLDIETDDVRTYHGIADLEKCWDIGTVAVLPEYRNIDSQIVSTTLYRAMHVSALDDGIDHYVSVIDKKVFQTFKLIGFPFVHINDSKPFSYLGSEESNAVYGATADFIPNVVSNFEETNRQSPELAQMISKHVMRLTVGIDVDSALMFKH